MLIGKDDEKYIILFYMPLWFAIVVTNCIRSNHGVSSRVIAPTGMIYTRIDWSQILQHQLLVNTPVASRFGCQPAHVALSIITEEISAKGHERVGVCGGR